MKKQLCVLTTILTIFSGVYAVAQTTITSSGSNTMQSIRVYDPFLTRYNNIDGSPYIPADTMRSGWLVIGTKRMPAKLRYNTQTGEVEYINDNKVITPVNPIPEFVILGADTLLFRKGFPAVGSWSPNDFYQVIYDGQRSKLVKHIRSELKSNTDPMQNDYGKERFQHREDYFIWTIKGPSATGAHFAKLDEGQMHSVVASKKSLTGLFPQDVDRIDKYLSEQKLKLKSWAEFANVLRYLDTQ